MFNGKINYKSPFSMAMLNYQRVSRSLCLAQPHTGHMDVSELVLPEIPQIYWLIMMVNQ